MDIRKIGNSEGVERGADRSKRAEPKRAGEASAVARDQAQISPSSRETAVQVETLAERARRADGDRDAKVAEAARKLAAGELDSPAVVRATAKSVLASKFASG